MICSHLVLDYSTVAGGHASFYVRILMIVGLHRELYGVNDYAHIILGLKLSNSDTINKLLDLFFDDVIYLI